MLRALGLVSLASLLALPASALSLSTSLGTSYGGIGGIGGVIWVPPPPTNPPPAKPAYLGVSLTFGGTTSSMPRTTSMAMHIGWRNVSDATTATITRTSPDFTVIGTVSNLVHDTNTIVIDPRPAVDQLNCYRVTVANAYGQTLSDTACMITPDGNVRPLWRAQLEVDVANATDAGTDSDVAVRLDSPTGLYGTSFLPSGNNTWIDTPADDFEQGSHRTYELMTDNLTGGLPAGAQPDVSDVKMITIANTGDDAMCVQGLNLILNGQSMFQKTFSSCVWVTSSQPLTVDTPELRASPLWHAQVPSVPTSVKYEMMDSLATLAVAQQLHGTSLSWRDTYFSDNPETWNWGTSIRNYEWAIDYDGAPLNLQASFALENTCVNGKAHARLYIEDTDVDAASWLELLAPLTQALVDAFTPDMPNLFDQSMDLGLNCTPGDLNIGLCFDGTGINPCSTTF